VAPAGAAEPGGGPGPAEALPRTSILRRAAESRLFSGSPEAEERARRLAGPPPAEMAERADTARRRAGQPPAPPEGDGGDPIGTTGRQH